VKYLEEGGVKYYDMEGVDAFESDTFTMKDKDGVAQTYNTKKAATTKEGKTYSNKFREEYKKRWKTTNIVNFRWIKDYEKRIQGLEKQLDSIEGTDAKKEVRQQINRLKEKIKALQDPKTITVQEKKTTRVESESEEDSDWGTDELIF
jgi:archaellum component FlaC